MTFLIVMAFIIAVIVGIVKLCFKLTKSGIMVAVILFALACVGLAGCGEPELIVQSEATSAKNDTVPKGQFKATIPETVLVDEKDVKITATKLTSKDNECELELKFENNTDKELSFGISELTGTYCAVNGYLMSDYVQENVAAGMMATNKFNMSSKELALYGITEIGTIDISFYVNDGRENYLITNPIRIETSEKNNVDIAADTFKDAVKNIDKIDSKKKLEHSIEDVVLDQNGLKVQGVYLISRESESKIILFEVENNGDTDINVLTERIAINGVTISSGTWNSTFIPKGTRGLVDIELENVIDYSNAADLGFSDISDVSFDITIKYKDSKNVDTKRVEIKLKDYSIDESGKTVYDNNGIKIVYKALVNDASSYSKEKHLMFFVKNSSGKEISVRDGYAGVYINKNKVSTWMNTPTLSDGEIGILGIRLDESETDVKEVSFKLKLSEKDSFKSFDEPTISFEVK